MRMLSELLDRNEQWNRTWFEKDAATVERLMAEDYIYVGPNGLVLDRQAILRIIRSPTYRLDHGTHTELVVRVIGREAAVVRHRWQGAGSFDGTSFTDNHRGLRVWEQRDGQWRIVVEQASFASNYGSKRGRPSRRRERIVTFKEIVFGTHEYRLECLLREEVLRRPLGLPLSDKDLADEESQLHFGLLDPAGELVACAVAARLSPTEAKIRQMAVSPRHQRKGMGQRLMRELEKDLKARGFQKFVLNARTSAVGFYEKLGYTVAGEEFLDVTVPHVKMSKAV